MSTNYINKITDTAGTTHDIQEGVDTRLFRATCTTAADTAAKVATLDDATNYSLAAGVRVAVTFTYGNSAATPTLNVNSGGAKNIVIPTAVATLTSGNGTTYNTWGPYETIIFTYNGSQWVQSGSGLSLYNAYALANSKTANTGTVTSIATGGGLTGGTITTSGTISHSNSVTAQTTQAVYPIKIDAQGHISAYGTAVTIPTVPSNIVNTITTSAGTHTTISSQKGNVSFNVPTKTSHLTNDSGFITSYTDTKVSTASISSTDTNLYYPVLGTNSTTASTKYINTNLLCYNTTVGQDKSTDLEIGNTAQMGRLILQDGGGYAVTLYTQQGLDALVELPGSDGQLALISDITDEKMKWTASTSTSTFYPLVSTSTATTGTANTPNGISYYQYYNTAGGYRRLDLGNSTNYTSSGGAYGMIRLYGTGATYYTDLKSGTPTGNRTITLPNATGTLALTSDIPDVPVVKNGRSSRVTINSSASTTVTVTYSGFTSAPRVVGTLYNVSSSTNQLMMYISTAPTTTQTIFTIRNNGTASRTAYIDWIAVGS